MEREDLSVVVQRCGPVSELWLAGSHEQIVSHLVWDLCVFGITTVRCLSHFLSSMATSITALIYRGKL